MAVERRIVEPKNSKLNASRNLNLPHSPGVRAGDFIFLSGTVSIDPETGEMKQGTLASETEQVLQNISHLLESAGSSLRAVVKVNVFLADMLEFQILNSVFRKYFPENPPARTVCGARLSLGFRVEIECIAIVE